jgi:hypothetical protein
MSYNLMLRVGPMSHTGTMRRAFLNKRVQFHLKPACALGYEHTYSGVKRPASCDLNSLQAAPRRCMCVRTLSC